MGTLKEGLRPGTEFWDAGKTLKHLLESSYFRQEGEGKGEDPVAEENMEDDVNQFKWPLVLQNMLSTGEF